MIESESQLIQFHLKIINKKWNECLWIFLVVENIHVYCIFSFWTRFLFRRNSPHVMLQYWFSLIWGWILILLRRLVPNLSWHRNFKVLPLFDHSCMWLVPAQRISIHKECQYIWQYQEQGFSNVEEKNNLKINFSTTRRCARFTCIDCEYCGDCGDCGGWKIWRDWIDCGDCGDCRDWRDWRDWRDCIDWRSEKVWEKTMSCLYGIFNHSKHIMLSWKFGKLVNFPKSP